MNYYIEIGDIRYPAIMVTYADIDYNWDNREFRNIILQMSVENALKIFVDNVKWSLVIEHETHSEIIDENGEVQEKTAVVHDIYDYSAYSVAGDIICHRDGTITVKMGKSTSDELLALLAEVM